MFEHCPESDDCELLMTLTEGDHHSAEYTLEFRPIAAGSGWNELVLKAVFCCGLNEEILTNLACRDENISLLTYFINSLIDLAIRLDNLLHVPNA